MGKYMRVVLCVVLLAMSAPAAAQNITDENLEQALRKLLKEKPELVLNILRENSEQVLDIAQQGSTQRRKRALEAQWREDVRNPKKVALQNRPVLGPANAPLTVVEFSDFTCPYCEQAAINLKKLMAEYGNKVKLVFKHMPLGKDGPSRLA